MKRDYDELLKQALAPIDEPYFWLNQKILRQVKEKKSMKKKTYKKIPAVVLAAVLVLGIGTITTFAAWKYLMLDEVAEVVKNEKLAEAFMSEDAVFVNEAQSYGGYQVTFLGMVSGADLTSFISMDDNGEIRSNLSHMVVAIENADGTPMPDISDDAYGELEFLVTPLVEGYNPVTYNAFAFGGSYTDEVVDGILYRVMECDNVEMFADCKLYLAVLDSTFYRAAAYNYDEASGEISRNESYDGLNALFSLPVDVAKADTEAAKAYMESLFVEDENETSGEMEDKVDETTGAQSEALQGVEMEAYAQVEAWIERITPENIDELAVRVEHTVQVLSVDENGYLNVAPYEIEGRGGSGECSISASWAFGDLGVGMSDQFSYMHSGTLDSLRVETFTKNEDGTYTFAVYIPKE
ncbi:MAG: hypothetical protein IKU69_00860 [Roseburia sp.]|nr:hypothetical protein [Roseburia sp.]